MHLWSAICASLLAAALATAKPLEVISALGPEVDRQVLEAVQSRRQAYAELGLVLRKPNLPTQVIVTPTVVELAPFIGPSSGRSRAFSLAGIDRNYIVLAWTAPGNPLRAAAHEYAHLVDPLEEAPLWFREGFAEYLSYLEPDAEGRLTPAAPARHVVRLRDSKWLPLHELLRAERDSAAAAAPTFYSQSWLLVHWLAAQEAPPGRLRPSLLYPALDRLGSAALEAALRAWLAELGGSPLWEPPADAVTLGAPGQTWRVRLALAEVDRELDRLDRARSTLEELYLQRPGDPSIAGALGALAMDEGRYDVAESLLEKAAAAPEAPARTRFRLALMLLRPAGEEARARAREAAEQARLALELYPHSSDYRLALAQALMVDEQWEASAGELSRLAYDPDWRARAEQEYAELVRRRQQALGAVERPGISQVPAGLAKAAQPMETPPIPLPPKPPPPPPMRWPPRGATILAGRIDYVDCSGQEKIIVMRHPLLTIRIRERKGKPAKLFHPPQKWTEIPCGAKGWTVNIAYYPDREDKSVLGDAAAILF